MSSPHSRSVGAVIFVVAYTTFLATFNETFLNVALTPMMQDLSVGSGTIGWVTTAYMLAAAIMVPVTGFLYRSVPTHRLLMTALTLLLAGAVLGAVAPSFAVVLVSRIVQALGTGMIVPIGMNLTLAVSPREKLGTNMGVVSAMTTLGPAFSPIIAGTILQFGTWHTLFVAFAVLIALAWIVAFVCVGDEAELTHPRLDAASTTLISLALIGILYGISTVFTGSALLAVACLGAGLVALVGFVIRQRYAPEPLIDLRPLGNRGFALGLCVIFASLMIVFSMNILLPMFMQSALGFSAFNAALTLLPACILSCILAPLAGSLFDRYGLRFSLPLALAVVVGFTFALSMLGEGAGSWQIMACYAPVIAGTAFTMGPAQTFALASLERPLFPHGTTIISTAFQVAGCIGSSLFMGILSGVQAGRVAGGESMAAATAAGFHAAALVAAGIAVVALVLAFRLARIERLQLRDRADGVREAAAEPVAEPAVAAAAQESGVLVD
ncbi:MFS transporter [Actinomyces procaprae]|uniref:MFS transporter n=1 Tax=Actinomyces procaprae TaxID=2560010 RepID=UPI001446D11D|nr:MFS transporter [Actinomyces procaprae]